MENVKKKKKSGHIAIILMGLWTRLYPCGQNAFADNSSEGDLKKKKKSSKQEDRKVFNNMSSQVRCTEK